MFDTGQSILQFEIIFSHHVIFVTQKGDVQVYDYKQHKLIFSDRIFNPNHNVSTLKTHPLGKYLKY